MCPGVTCRRIPRGAPPSLLSQGRFTQKVMRYRERELSEEMFPNAASNSRHELGCGGTVGPGITRVLANALCEPMEFGQAAGTLRLQGGLELFVLTQI